MAEARIKTGAMKLNAEHTVSYSSRTLVQGITLTDIVCTCGFGQAMRGRLYKWQAENHLQEKPLTIM